MRKLNIGLLKSYILNKDLRSNIFEERTTEELLEEYMRLHDVYIETPYRDPIKNYLYDQLNRLHKTIIGRIADKEASTDLLQDVEYYVCYGDFFETVVIPIPKIPFIGNLENEYVRSMLMCNLNDIFRQQSVNAVLEYMETKY